MSVPYIDVNMFTKEFLEELREHTDPAADDVIEQFIDVELADGARRLLKDELIKHHPGSDDASPSLSAFIHQFPDLPDWADLDMLERGQDLFAEFVPQLGLALWMASIPGGYAGARDVVVLERSNALVSHPQRRFLETGQFVIDVMQHGALQPGEQGAIDIRHVRLMHAAVRHMLVHEADQLPMEDGSPCPPWDFSTGKPLNQEALLATQFTFSVVGVQSLERFGVHLSDHDKDCYVHAWAIVGHLMGIRPDLQPLNYADSAIVWERIKEKEYAESEAGKHLTKHALIVMRRLMPGKLLDGVPASGINFLLGSKTAKMLGVKKNWTYVLFPPMHWMGGVMNRFEKHSPFGRRVTEWLGRKVFQAFIDLEWEGRTRVRNFEVPTQLERRLGIDSD